MTGPPVQRFGEAVILQGAAVPEISYLVGLGLRHRAAVDGAPPSVRQRQLLRILADAAEASLALPPTPRGHADTIATPHLGESVVGEISTAEAARLLGITSRHARRLASDLDGRRVKGTWLFDRHAVVAYATQRKETE